MPAAPVVPVLVAGRGPVGMTLALRLAGLGVPTAVADPAGRSVDPGSKAVLMAGDALEILGRAGVGPAVLERGVVLARARTFRRETELFRVEFGPETAPGYPPAVNHPQAATEALLLERVEAEPLIEKHWGARLVSLAEDEHGVTAEIEDASGRRRLRARYVAGCDGARSTVRKLLGVGFHGHAFDDWFLIADVRADAALPRDERRFWFDPASNPGRTTLLHPQPGGWHFDWQTGVALDPAEEVRSGRLDARVRSVLGQVAYEVEWLTTYRFLQLIADRFASRRVFLVGDAAHLYAPYGARGLNSGIADADNLAWKLWLVLEGAAPSALLDTYGGERRAAALENLRVTAATARFMAPPGRARRLWRDAVLAGAARVPALRRLVNSGRFYAPHVYAGSPIVAPGLRGGGGPANGAVAPDARVSGAALRLREAFGSAFLALHLAPSRDAAGAVAAGAPAAGAVPCRVLHVLPAGTQTRPGAVVDGEGEVARAYAPDGLPHAGRVVLVRPDGHVASRHDLSSAGDLAALRSWLEAAVTPSG